MNRYQLRVHTIQESLREQRGSLLIVAPGANMLFLSGFSDQSSERLLLFLLPEDGDPFFVAPELYADQIMANSPFPRIHAWKDAEGPIRTLACALAPYRQTARSVLVDEGMRADSLLLIQEVLPKARFVPASPVIRRLRMRKDQEELSLLAEAASIADRALAEISQLRFSGLTERELARALEEAMVAGGAEEIAFETLVASGPNSALPHHRAGQRRIERGDVVILDFGCQVGGYCSDITRTVVCGEPASDVQAAHHVVAEAQEQAVRAVRPGATAQEIDQVARGAIAAAGLGERFIHRTGHGVGLDVHEEPYIVAGNPLTLEQGMVFSVEPGVYFPGQFGVRVEDVVVVTDSSVQRLNRYSRALQVVR